MLPFLFCADGKRFCHFCCIRFWTLGSSGYRSASAADCRPRLMRETSPDRAIRAIRLGRAIRPLNRSDRVPDQVDLQHRTHQHEQHNNTPVYRDGFPAEQGADVDLTKEIPADDGGGKAKKSMQIATKMLPKEPKAWLNAICASVVAVSPLLSMPEVRMTSAVSVRDNKGVDEYPDHRDISLVLGFFHLGQRVGRAAYCPYRLRWKTAPAQSRTASPAGP